MDTASDIAASSAKASSASTPKVASASISQSSQTAVLARAGKQPKRDAETNALCIQTLQQFRIGLAQSVLYTEESKQFEKSSFATFEALDALIAKIGGFKLNVSKSDALINGERVDIPVASRASVQQIEKALTNAGLNCLRFEQGLTIDELRPFLQMLARKKLGSTDSAQINETLRAHNITHVQVDEIRYVAIGKEEHVITGDVPALSQNSLAQGTLSEMVRSTFESILNVQDPQAQIQLRSEMADQLLEQDAGMLAGMLAATSQRLKQGCSDEHLALAALPFRDGQILAESLQVCKILTERGSPDSDPAWQALQRLIQAITEPYKSRAEDILSKMQVDEQSIKALPEWLRQAQQSLQSTSAEERLEGIMRQSPNALLDEKMFQQILDILDEFSVARMDEQAGKLMAHISGALKALTKRDRAKAVERLSFLLERSMEQASEAVKILEDSLLDACTHETCDEVMELLLKHLCGRCVHHYQLGNYDRALEHLSWIASLEESSRLALRDEGANCARLARDKLGATEFSRTLAADLLDTEQKGTTARSMARVLGTPVWTAVVERLCKETDAEVLHALAEQLGQAGKENIQLFYDALTRESDSSVVERLMELIPVLGDEQGIWANMPQLLAHADATARARTLEYVIRHDGEPAAKVLQIMLQKETGFEQRRHWLHSLSKLHDLAGQRILLDELNSAVSNTALDETWVIALLDAFYAIENPAVAEVASKLLDPSRPTPAPKSLKIAALRAIGRYYRHPVAQNVIEHARRDKDTDISRLALVCQRGIIASEHQTGQPGTPVNESQETPPERRATMIMPAAKKPRRAFDSLDTTAIDNVFQPGAAIGSANPEQTPQRAPIFLQSQAKQIENFDKTILANERPRLEGLLKDCRLASAISMAGGRDGVMQITDPQGEGFVFIRDRRVLNAQYVEQTGMQALIAMDDIRDGAFAYFAIQISIKAVLDFRIENLQDELRRYRDQHDQNLYL